MTFFTSEDSDLKGVIEEMVKSRRSVQGSGKEMLVEMPVHIALHMEALRVRSEDVVRWDGFTCCAMVIAVLLGKPE